MWIFSGSCSNKGDYGVINLIYLLGVSFVHSGGMTVIRPMTTNSTFIALIIENGGGMVHAREENNFRSQLWLKRHAHIKKSHGELSGHIRPS